MSDGGVRGGGRMPAWPAVSTMSRRGFLRGSSAVAGLGALGSLGLSGCSAHARVGRGAAVGAMTPGLPFYDAPGVIVPIRADLDRIFRITVCLRPFRAAGPRMEVERAGDKVVVHNYGHGGSGWSLSWGSADAVVRRAMEAAPGVKECAVVGCGALGLTAALTAQRMGMRVTIYAKERPPYVRSARATGSWTPDSRIALQSAAAPGFAAEWERMARTSFAMYQSYLGSAGTPVEWTDRYVLRDGPGAGSRGGAAPAREGRHEFAFYSDRIDDITPGTQEMPRGSTPFPTRYVGRTSSLTFNVASYSRQLVEEFQVGGGRIETREFHSPAEVLSLEQSLILNCTGYGARALWGDESVVPVRGQIAWLIPQEGVNYGIYYKGLNVLARRDGIVIQPSPRGEETGWNDANEEPDRAEAEAGVGALQELYGRMGAWRG